MKNITINKKTFVIASIVFIIGVLFPGFVFAANYYVDKNSLGGSCSDSKSGTITEPWCTIGKANNALQPGDTVYVRQGTYSEIIEPLRSGTEGNKITYKNYNNEKVTISGESGKFIVITIGYEMNTNWNPRSYIVIDGFTVRHIDPNSVSDYPVGIMVYGANSHHNEIRNNKVECQGAPVVGGGREHAISISKSSYNIVENNYIDGWCRIGILAGGSGRYNIIRNNTVLDTYSGNINIGSSKGVMQGTLIENNFLCGDRIQDNIQFETRYDLPEGVIDYDSNRGVVIRNNVLCNAAENGVDLKGAAYVVIEGNTIYGNTGNNDGGLPVHNPDDTNNRTGGMGGIMHGSGAGSRNVIIRNNIIYDSQGGILPEAAYKIYNNDIVYNNRDYTGPNSSYTSTRKPAFSGIAAWNNIIKVGIKNNIIGGHNVADIAARTSSGSLDIDNNIYFNDAGAKMVDFRANYDWSVLSFSAWKSLLATKSTITGKDANSMDTDPLFVNVPQDPVGSHKNFDFHLKPTSPAINRGIFLTKTRSSGTGTQISVDDATYFFDGYGIVAGDTVQLEGQTQTAKIISVDYDNNILTVDKSLSWYSGQGISLPYSGSNPDIGAYEFTDTAPPTVPTNLKATAISSSQINLSWTASTDNVGVTGYRIYRGGVQIATLTTTSYSNTGLAPSTTYTYTVRAYDAAGNLSNASNPASATTNTAVVTGPAGYWKFDDGSGATAVDSSGNGNNGTLINGPNWTTGQVNGALNFNGDDDYISVSRNSSLDVTTFTIAGWVKLTNVATANQFVFWNGNTASPWGGWGLAINRSSVLGCDVGEICLWVSQNSGSNFDYVEVPHNLTVNDKWYHIAATWNNSTKTATYYVDGTPIGSATSSYAVVMGSSPNTYAGRGASAGYFNGAMDEVRVYNYALSAAEISALYNNSQATSFNPIASYHFSEGSGTTTSDSSENGNTCTISGAVWTNSGKSGKALNFDGNYTYLDCGTKSSLNLNSSFTASAWVKTNKSSETYQAILMKSENNYPESLGQQGWELIYRSSSAGFRFGIRDQNDKAVLVNALPSGNIGDWHHVVGVYDDSNNTMRLYIDGIVRASSTKASLASFNAPDWSFKIGRYAGGYSFRGTIDEVRVYNRALSAQEVSSLYNEFALADNALTATVDSAVPPSQKISIWKKARYFIKNILGF